jgi:hypothetical protein
VTTIGVSTGNGATGIGAIGVSGIGGAATGAVATGATGAGGGATMVGVIEVGAGTTGVVIIVPATGAKGVTIGAITGEPIGGWEMGACTAGVTGAGARAVPGVWVNGFDGCINNPNKLRRNGLNWPGRGKVISGFWSNAEPRSISHILKPNNPPIPLKNGLKTPPPLVPNSPLSRSRFPETPISLKIPSYNPIFPKRPPYRPPGP